MSGGRPTARSVALGAGGLVVFLAEAVMFAGLYLAARALAGSGAAGVLAGLAALAAGIAAWGRWLAPTAARRVPALRRAIAAVAAAAAVYAAGTLVAGEHVPRSPGDAGDERPGHPGG